MDNPFFIPKMEPVNKLLCVHKIHNKPVENIIPFKGAGNPADAKAPNAINKPPHIHNIILFIVSINFSSF